MKLRIAALAYFWSGTLVLAIEQSSIADAVFGKCILLLWILGPLNSFTVDVTHESVIVFMVETGLLAGFLCLSDWSPRFSRTWKVCGILTWFFSGLLPYAIIA